LQVDGTENEAICVVAPSEEALFEDGTSWCDNADDGPSGPSKVRAFEETLA